MPKKHNGIENRKSRCYLSRKSNQLEKDNPKARRSVHFSKVQDVRVYKRRDEVDNVELYYTDADLNMMLNTRRRDLGKARQGYATSQLSGDPLDGDALSGIENFLTQDIMQTAVSCKKGCLSALLREQARQRAAGKFDPCKLAEVSKIQSMWATKRAESIAIYQSR